MSDFTASLAAAIQRFEGWKPGSVSYRNNNPGNLRAGVGQSGTDANGYAIFPDYQTGFAALERQVDINIGRGLSLDEFFGGKPGVYPGYAPSGDSNDPGKYSQVVAGWLGIDPNTPLQDITSGSGVVSLPPIDGTDYTQDPSADPSAGVSAMQIAAIAAGAGILLLLILD